MDVETITSFRRARTRADLAVAPGEVFLAGGTWLMSEPQVGTSGFIDLTTLDWPDLEISDVGLRIGANCTIAHLVAWSRSAEVPAAWAAASVIPDAANALLASFKIWNTATVGGNLGRAYSAGAIVSYAAALDGVAWIWRPDGTDRRIAVADLMTGNGTHSLAHGEVIRAVELPAAALRSRLILRKIALAELGRSGSVVTGRLDEDGGAVFTVSAATLTPTVFRFEELPDATSLRDAVAGAPDYYTDPLGSADWRRGVSIVLAGRIRDELAAS